MSVEIGDILDEYKKLVNELIESWVTPSFQLLLTYNEESRAQIKRLCQLVIGSLDRDQQKDYDFCLRQLLIYIAIVQREVKLAIDRHLQPLRYRDNILVMVPIIRFQLSLQVQNYKTFHEEISRCTGEKEIPDMGGITRAIAYEIEVITRLYIRFAVCLTNQYDFDLRYKQYLRDLSPQIKNLCSCFKTEYLDESVFRIVLDTALGFIRTRIEIVLDENNDTNIQFPWVFDHIRFKLLQELPMTLMRWREESIQLIFHT